MRNSSAFDEAEAGDEKSCHWVITNPVLERVLQVTFRIPLSQVPVAITSARRATQLLKGYLAGAQSRQNLEGLFGPKKEGNLTCTVGNNGKILSLVLGSSRFTFLSRR